mmetsp:Transcript_17409/g.19949  ORF Transcript_17409/g.19949 Transcript_17409/m.19949 type:complete len:417 (+) Transcript_17409:216-1466(+)
MNSVSMNANLIANRSTRSSPLPPPASSTSVLRTNSDDTSNGTMILACSPVPPTSSSVRSLQAKLTAARAKFSHTTTSTNEQNALILQYKNGVAVDGNGYPLGQYQKKFFDQLKLKSLITSTLRVTIQQATMIVATFMSQQLENDLKRNVSVDEGQLTQFDADIEAEEWEKVEWKKRWKTFPLKVLTALAKFHAVTFILRSYEYLADKVFHCNLYTMDKLTMDPFQMSKRLVVELEKKSPSTMSSKKDTVMDHKVYVISTMTATTFWSSVLSFGADYSLHQGLLCYGYYKYYNYQRQKRLTIISAAAAAADDDSDYSDDCNYSSAIAITDDDKLLALDLVKKSFRLGGNRTVGLLCSAVGGGLGSVVWPGWGVIVGSAVGDNVAGLIVDDGFYKAKEMLEEKQRKEEKQQQQHDLNE